MTNLSPEDIAGLIKYYADTGNTAATFHTPISPDNAVKAIAICLAESGGKVDAESRVPNKDGTKDWGLWQINDVHHPSDVVKKYAAPNWQTAYAIAHNGTDWRPWSTYKSGKYIQHMGAAAAAWQTAKPISGHDAQAKAGLPASGEVTDAPTETRFSGPLAFLNVFLDKDIWWRIAAGATGALLLLIFTASVLKDQALPASMKALGAVADTKTVIGHAGKVAAAPGQAATKLASSTRIGGAVSRVAR